MLNTKNTTEDNAMRKNTIHNNYLCIHLFKQLRLQFMNHRRN